MQINLPFMDFGKQSDPLQHLELKIKRATCSLLNYKIKKQTPIHHNDLLIRRTKAKYMCLLKLFQNLQILHFKKYFYHTKLSLYLEI